MLSSRSLISQYVSCVADGGMSADDVEVHSLPMYHCAQLDCFFCVDVYLGATSIILPGPDPATLLAAIAQEQVTKLFCPPTVWISLLRHPDFATRTCRAAQGLLRRFSHAGGGPAGAATAAAAHPALELLRPDRDGAVGDDLGPQSRFPGFGGPGFDERGDLGRR